MSGNILSHGVTEGFKTTVETAIEAKSYPHRARDTVGAVPAPRYTFQREFSLTNPAFKGYGVESKLSNAGGGAPYGTSTESPFSIPPKGPRVLPPHPTDALTKTVAIETPAQTGSCRAYQTKLVPKSCMVPSGQALRDSDASATRNDPPLQKKTVTVGELMRGRPEAPPEAPPIPQASQVASRTVLVAGRPTSSSSAAGPLDQQRTREALRAALRNCGALFESVLRSNVLFEQVWTEAGGSACADATVSVAKFRLAMEHFGV